MVNFDMSKISKNFYFLIIIIIITVIFVTLFNIIKPNKSYPPYNLSSFPEISPTDLPDAKSSASDCNNTIQYCYDGSCEKCGDSTFTCRTISEDDPPHYLTTGTGVKIQIPTNKPVCIPDKKHSASTDCNTYTGSWVWTSGSKQGWTCSCKYPDLFGDPQTGCEKMFACSESINNDIVLTDKGAKYLNTKHNTNIFTRGQIYDPTAKKGGIDSTLLKENLYSVDDQGNSVFECKCAKISGLTAQIGPLPRDPFTCHKDICWPNSKKSAATFDAVKGEIICNCKGGIKIGSIKSESGKTIIKNRSGLCESNNFCAGDITSSGNVGGHSNPPYNTCTCDANYQLVKCNSSNISWDGIKRECAVSDNPIGWECTEKCGTWTCPKYSKCVLDKGKPVSCACATRDIKDMAGKIQSCKGTYDKSSNKCTWKWPPGSKVLSDDGWYIQKNYGSPQSCNISGKCQDLKVCDCDGGSCCEKEFVDVSGASSGNQEGVCSSLSATKDGGDCSGLCIGGSTLLQTENGIQTLNTITPGTKVMTLINNEQKLQPILCIYTHGEIMENHLEILTDNGDRIVLTEDHYIYLQNGDMVHGKDLKIGDKLNKSIIMKINTIKDIPLTPVLVGGIVITKGNTIVSSWSGTKENINLMNGLLKLINEFILTHTVEEVASVIQATYTEFRNNDKKHDENSLKNIANKYNINLPKIISIN